LKKHTFEDCASSDLLKICSFFANEHGTCLLFSGGKFETSKKSYLFLFPFDSFAIIDLKQSQEFKSIPNVISSDSPWDTLNEKITDDFWVGFLGYEMGAYSDKELITPIEKTNIPLAYFQRSLVTIEYDHGSSIITMDVEDCSFVKNQRYLIYVDQLVNLKKFIKNIPDIKKEKFSSSTCLYQEDKTSYLNKIKSVHESIRSGEVYQLNLSHEIKLKSSILPIDAFNRLINQNPTSFSAYFYLNDMAIVSNSPERLLKKEGSHLDARPIKGTIKRGSSENQEKENSAILLSCKKERAELTMITDLLRNDLSKISQIGSVSARLFQLEKYENIIHMFSVVQSKANTKFSNVEILREIFPGGSITGCPKLEAKKLIYKLEKRARNIYTGSIGYFRRDQFDFNICIRTLLFDSETVSAQLGGAIVSDSDPEKEYQETLIKGKSIFDAMNVQWL